MINDYSILSISETNDITIIKKAFRARVKDLHPDVSNASIVVQNHFLFIEVCNAYERLSKKVKEGTPQVVLKTPITNQQIEMQKHQDPAFVYYKTACKYYELVHPSHWNIDKTITINGKTDEENKLQKATMEKVKELVNFFPKAYYYFSIVIHEYPDSVWFHDSQEKMLLIEKRMKTYKNIIESFIT